MQKRVLLLRPFYGITIHNDMHGDLGIVDFLPQTFPDLALIFSSSIAKQYSSIKLDIIDANALKLFPDQIIKNVDYDIIIVKAAAPTIKYDIEVAKKMKLINKNAEVILTGHAARLLNGWIIENIPEIDEVYNGFIEDLIYRIATGENKHVLLNEFPVLDYTSFPYHQFVDSEGQLRATLYSCRGCIMKCSYCPYTSLFEGKCEFRSINKIISDIKHLYSLGFRSLHFRDQFFTVNKSRTHELCREIINLNFDIKWRAETRIDTLDTELIDIMVKAGLDMVFIGIESASNELLHYYGRKTFDLNRAKEMISYLNSRGVCTIGFYMIGFPDQAWDDIMDTYHMAINLNTSLANFSIYTPYPFSSEWKSKYNSSDITPELFIPFENTIKIGVSNKLNKDELEFALNQTTLMYASTVFGMDHANKISQYQKKNSTRVRSVKKKIELAMNI